MNKITSYRDLLVWKRAMELAAECFRLTQTFPRNEEFGLKAQMRRASLGKMLNGLKNAISRYKSP